MNPLSQHATVQYHKFKYLLRVEKPVLHNRQESQDDTPYILDVPKNT